MNPNAEPVKSGLGIVSLRGVDDQLAVIEARADSERQLRRAERYLQHVRRLSRREADGSAEARAVRTPRDVDRELRRNTEAEMEAAMEMLTNPQLIHKLVRYTHMRSCALRRRPRPPP